MQVSKNFRLQEFIDPITYKRFRASSIWFMDSKLFNIAQEVRDLTHSPVKINDWANSGQYRESGLRNWETLTGAKYSQHKFGRAIDIKVQGWGVEDVYKLIMKHEEKFRYLGLTTIESINKTPTWIHLDTRNWAIDKIHIVNP